jgi:hypothetical protein
MYVAAWRTLSSTLSRCVEECTSQGPPNLGKKHSQQKGRHLVYPPTRGALSRNPDSAKLCHLSQTQQDHQGSHYLAAKKNSHMRPQHYKQLGQLRATLTSQVSTKGSRLLLISLRYCFFFKCFFEGLEAHKQNFDLVVLYASTCLSILIQEVGNALRALPRNGSITC